jgi:hypothetical protein
MNLHSITDDIVIKYLKDRYPTYIFERLSDEIVRYQFEGTIGRWETMTAENYRVYARHAVEWRAQTIST